MSTDGLDVWLSSEDDADTVMTVVDGSRRKSSRSMRQILDRHPKIEGSTRRKLLGPGQIGRERRHRMHWLLANELHEAGVPADEAFVCLWDTKWNKHKDQGAPVRT
jgi:hypothetical protein